MDQNLSYYKIIFKSLRWETPKEEPESEMETKGEGNEENLQVFLAAS